MAPKAWALALACACSVVACGAADIGVAPQEQLAPPQGASGDDASSARRSPEMKGYRTAHNPHYDPNRWISATTAAFAHTFEEDKPFGSRDGTECAATCAAAPPLCALQDTEVPYRRDLSSKQECLPMRLMLRVLGPDCLPIADAQVSVWHPSPQGAYSGPTGRPRLCAPREPHAARRLTFRGQQATGCTGEVTFDSCFPGASPGHTPTINIEISRHGALFLATRLLFDDAMVADIEATQPLYAARVAAVPPTRNSEDPNIVPAHVPAMTLDVIQVPDGTMLAYKTLVLRADTAAPLCSFAPQPLVPQKAATPQNSNAS